MLNTTFTNAMMEKTFAFLEQKSFKVNFYAIFVMFLFYQIIFIFAADQFY